MKLQWYMALKLMFLEMFFLLVNLAIYLIQSALRKLVTWGPWGRKVLTKSYIWYIFLFTSLFHGKFGDGSASVCDLVPVLFYSCSCRYFLEYSGIVWDLVIIFLVIVKLVFCVFFHLAFGVEWLRLTRCRIWQLRRSC